MKTKTNITIIALLALILTIVPLAGCNNNASEPDETTTVVTETDAPEPTSDLIGEGLKAAMLLPGPISDIGYNGPAYEGLLRIESELAYEISYAESVDPADYENVLRTYAQEGYNLIFAHGNQFLETVTIVAEEFPDTWFAVTSAFTTNEKNISGMNLSSHDVGFLSGALMAQMPDVDKIGMVSGAEIPPLVMIYDGLRAGAAYINPEVEIANVYTDARADMAACKEAAVALLDSGSDILSTTAGTGAPGVISAAADAGKYFVGNSSDWSSVDPETVLNSVITDWGSAVVNTATLYAKGELQPIPYMNGIVEGAVYFLEYGEHALEVIPEEVLSRMDTIIEDIKAGKIIIADEVAALPEE